MERFLSIKSRLSRVKYISLVINHTGNYSKRLTKGALRIITRFHKNQNHNSVNKIHLFWMALKLNVILQVGLQFTSAGNIFKQFGGI
jgi:hypothetical protein